MTMRPGAGLGGRGRQPSKEKLARVKSLAEERMFRDMREAAHNALTCIVRRAGSIRVTQAELESLKRGDGLSILADSEGMLITFGREGEAPAPSAPPPEGAESA